MAFVVKDRVQETTSTTGTGTLTLSGATLGFQAFSAIGDGNTTSYTIISGNDWEVGIGTYTSSGTTLSRDTILESSNSGSAISLSGVSNVFCTYPAERSVFTTDIGVTVQGYDADTAKYDDTTANFTGTLQNGGSNVVVDSDIGSTVQGYDADTAKYDDTTANFTGTLQNGGSNVVVDSDIGSTVQAYDATIVVDADIGVSVQAYDADTAKYDDVTANFTGTLQNGGSNVVVDSDIGSTVQGYDADTAKLDTAQTWTATQTYGDNVKQQFGASNDLQIYHSGTASYVSDTGTGNLVLQGTNVQLRNAGDTANYLVGVDGGATSIQYNGNTKLATSNTGVDVTGTLTATDVTIGGSSVVVDTDIGSTVQAYDADTTKNDVANTFTANQTINANLIVDTSTLYVDATNNRVGIGNAATDIASTQLDQLVVGSGSGNQGMVIDCGTGGQSRYGFGEAGTIKGGVQYDCTGNTIDFYVENLATPVADINSSGTVTATTFSGALSGNATTATTLQTGRTISLTGDVTGTSGTFNGGANLSFATNIASNVVGASELNVSGNGTSGQYLASDGDGTMTWTDLPAADAFDSGTLMLFQQTAAPTGWTKQTTHNDKSLRVVSGTASSGGSVAFTTAFASKPVSGSVSITGITGSAGATTLSTSQIPSHTHPASQITGGKSGGNAGNNPSQLGPTTTGATGGGGSHSHPFSFSSGTASFSGTAINLAVQYVDLIIASKD